MNNDKKKKIIDWIVKIVLIIIIIFLLIHNCELRKNENGKIPTGNVDIIEIKCENNVCKKEIESLNFAQKKYNVKKDESIKLIVTIRPSGLIGSKLTWKSSDESIATVDSNGVVKGLKEGKVTITVTSANGKTATCVVEVVKDAVNVESIKLTPEDPIIDTGSTTQVIAVITPENATNRDLVWSSSDTSIATVDGNGVVKGHKAGTVTITAKTKDGKIVATTTITVETPSESGSLMVYDAEHNAATWNGATDLNIFEKSMYQVTDKIAPESSNTYQFIIKNSTNYQIKYNIDFIENNPYHINMKYKLKKNDTYIIDHYVSASELDISNYLLNSNINDTYYLEWKWISSSNDTEIGANPESFYGLKIEVKAESTNG